MEAVIADPGSAARRAALAQMYARMAVELFAERGYRAVTVAEVAAALGDVFRIAYAGVLGLTDTLGRPRRPRGAAHDRAGRQLSRR